MAFKGQIAWNKGLTKETDDRVLKYSRSLVGNKPSLETRKKIGNAQRGRKQPLKTIKKRSNTLKKIGHTPPHLIGEKSSHWKGGLPKCIDCKTKLKHRTKKYPTQRCKPCSYLYFRGKNSRSWKNGGTVPLTKKIRRCFQYRQWRSDIFTRDDYTCQVCGTRGGYIEADHYPKMFSEIFHQYKIKSLEEALACEEFWNINNGRTVCRKHNPRGVGIRRAIGER